LNPLRADGVRIFAKMLTALPAQNVKSLPGMQISYLSSSLPSTPFPLARGIKNKGKSGCSFNPSFIFYLHVTVSTSNKTPKLICRNPALQMLRSQPQARHQTIVEASSGSTVLSLGILSRALWGHDDVHAYVTNKKHPDSLRLLKFFGLKT